MPAEHPLKSRRLPPRAKRWMIAYLTAVAGLVAAGLVLRIFGLGTGTGVPEALLLTTALLTLPVSTAYLVVVALGSSQGPVSGEAAFGALTATAALYYLGFLLLAAVNATVFTWIVVRVQVRRTARPGPLSDVQPQPFRRVGRVPRVPAPETSSSLPARSRSQPPPNGSGGCTRRYGCPFWS
jgi:hypothetical protein